MNIDQIVKGYTPSASVASLLDNTPTVLFCGITAAGKDTIQEKLLKTGSFTRIVTSTTRNPRENNGVLEQHGREYYFFSKEEAASKVRNKEYFEVANVHENFNGVTADEVRRLHASGKVAVGDVDYQGVEYFHSHVPSVMAIFIVPPSYEEWRDRMRNRYDTEDDFLEALPLRRQSAIRELRWAIATSYCHIVVNDDLDTAVSQIRSIIDSGGDVPRDTGAKEIISEILEKMISD